MEFQFIQFIRDTLIAKKVKLKDITDEISKSFNVELAHSDVSFIYIEYRNVLLDLWTNECLKILNDKMNLSELNEVMVIELLDIFRNTKAFDETPDYLQDDFYKLIKEQKQIFTPKNFVKLRRQITEYLSYIIMSFGTSANQIFEFYELLIEVFRNAYDQLENITTALKIQEFINGRLTIYELSRIVMEKNFKISKYEELKQMSANIIDQRSAIEGAIQKKVKSYLEPTKITNFHSGGKEIIKIERKILTSADLNSVISPRTAEFHIVCDILHIDSDLSDKYRGKNILVVTNTIRLHKSSTWDLSGRDAKEENTTNPIQFSNGDGENGRDGKPGESGGNAEIFSTEIDNAELWTLKSNGGNGSNGQDGGNGADGANGHDIQTSDFKIVGQRITTVNFIDLLNQIGVSTEDGSRSKNYFENGFIKHLVFNRNGSTSELLMLIKGSKGKIGGLGGFGGFGGQGGFGGKINVNCDSKGFIRISLTGSNGYDGKNGFNGRTGRDGEDAYMKISSNDNKPKYGVSNQMKIFEVRNSTTQHEFSVYYKPHMNYKYIAEIGRIQSLSDADRNNQYKHILKLSSDEQDFFEVFEMVMKNANERFDELIRKLDIQQFIVSYRHESLRLAKAIVNNSFDIYNYDILQGIAKLFTTRSLKSEQQLRQMLKSFTKNANIVEKTGKVYEYNKKVLTTNDLNAISQDFDELNVICEMLHVNSGLSEKFRGKKLAIYADNIIIHKSIEFNMSGVDNDNTSPYKNGGDFYIDCENIKNASLLTIKSNGGDLKSMKSITNAQSNEFTLNDSSITRLQSTFQTFKENGFIKYFIKNGGSSLLLVKGDELGAVRFAYPGNVFVKSSSKFKSEINCIMNSGEISEFVKDSRDLAVCVKNEIRRAYGINQQNKYELMTSTNERENSVNYGGKNYFPKLSRKVTTKTGIDDLEFYENLVWVLRNSFEKFDDVVEKLEIKSFTSNHIKLDQVVEKVQQATFDIGNYSNLKNCTKNFKSNQIYQETIQQSLKKFFQSMDVSYKGDKIIIKQKIFKSSQLFTQSINSSVNEIQIFCDTLHINSDLPSFFRGINLAISANYVQVHKNVTWDLSGLPPASNSFNNKAGQDYYGVGIDGQDGTAGNSGGNFYLHCKLIENSSALLIQSNGSDGTNGQSGGDGRDGTDGAHVNNDHFKIRDNKEWEINRWNLEKVRFSDNDDGIKIHSFSFNYQYYSSTYFKGFYVERYLTAESGFIENLSGFLIIHGKSGTPGARGGLPGYGGQGGFSGEIYIKSEECEHFIKILVKKGNDGENGQNGYDGKKGYDGCDGYKYDKMFTTGNKIHGTESTKCHKYGIEYSDERSGDHCIETKDGRYIRPVAKSRETPEKKQNDSKLTRDRNQQATSKKRAEIDKIQISQETSDILSENQSFKKSYATQKSSSLKSTEILTDKSSFSSNKTAAKNQQKQQFKLNQDDELTRVSANQNFKFRTPSKNLEAVKKTDILKNQVLDMYSSSLEFNSNYINDLSKKLSGVTTDVKLDQDEVKIATTVQKGYEMVESYNFEKWKACDAVSYLKFLTAIIKKSDINIIRKMIQESRFNRLKYEDLLKYKATYELQPAARNVEMDPKNLTFVLEKFIQLASSQQHPDISQFYQLYIQKNPFWKNCVSDVKFINSLLTKIKSIDPAFYIDYIKNSFKNQQVESEDIVMICSEKNLQKIFNEIYQKIHNELTKENYEVTYTSTSFIHQMRFFKDCDEFKSNSQKLRQHFINCGVKEKQDILDFFLINVKNYKIGVAEAVFNLMTDLADEIVNLSDILKDFLQKVIKILSESTQQSQNIFAAENTFSALIEEFFSNQKVMEFITTDIQSKGIMSKIYRKILSYKFNISFVILVKDFNGDLRVSEDHNYPHDLWFTYKSIDELIGGNNELLLEPINSLEYEISQQKSEIFILFENDKYSTVDFNHNSYSSYMKRIKLEKTWEKVIKSIKSGQNIPEYLKQTFTKFKSQNVKILNILDDESSFIDHDTLITIIMSNFPYTVLKYDENGVKIIKFYKESDLLLIKSKTESETQNEDLIDDLNPPHYEEQDESNLRKLLESNMSIIATLDGMSILKAIALRMYNDTNFYNLSDFSIIIQVITDILVEQESAKNLLTFLCLSNEQEQWPFELGILKLENLVGIVDKSMRNVWYRSYRNIKDPRIQQLFLRKVTEVNNKIDTLSLEDLDEIFENIEHFDENIIETLINSSLKSWKLMTTEGYWRHQITKLRKNRNDKRYDHLKEVFEDLSSKYGTKAKTFMKILIDKKKQLNYINITDFIGFFTVGESQLSQNILDTLKATHVINWFKMVALHQLDYNSPRNANKLAQIINADDETSYEVKTKIENIKDEVAQVFTINSPSKGKKIMDYTETEVKEWIADSSERNLIECLAIITRSFQIITNNKITLRDTQLMSIFTMWHNSNNGILMQVSTGEGKTFIGVSFAILKVLHGEKIDIITSSSVLAIRDVKENKKIFDLFGISVDHNCYEDSEKRKIAYTSQVVYGVLGNFQRDYLLTSFYNENFLSGHHFNNILVDEVDSMLLDKGNNILYLSSELPDIDEVEVIFVFIWYYVTQYSQSNEQMAMLDNKKYMRKMILDKCFGVLDEDDLKMISETANVSEILQQLRRYNILDINNLLCDTNFDNIKFNEALKNIDTKTSEKIKYLCSSKIEAKKSLNVPMYLKDFVALHVDKWVKSAIRAMILQNEKEYIIDRVSDGYDLSPDPKIIILDIDTGTDMSNSQWDEGLHQFLQIKHGCRLTKISLKSVFISNVSYFKKYNKLYGMTGTLGSLEERKKTTEIHEIDFITLPRYIPQKFIEYPSILEKDSEKWVKKICNEIKDMYRSNRSVLVICEAIHDTNVVSKELLKETSIFTKENVHLYQRDAKEFFKGDLQPKHVIISTNLAGRGTNIKLSEQLNHNGGLHVILTYLPQNKRIENQAFGRASRAGDKGSGRLIIYSDSNRLMVDMKTIRNQNEIKRLDEVNIYYKNFIKIEENVFEKFHKVYKELKSYLKPSNRTKRESSKYSNEFFNSLEYINLPGVSEIYLQNFGIQFSLWLDRNQNILKNWKDGKDDGKQINKNFEEFLSKSIPLYHAKAIGLNKILMSYTNVKTIPYDKEAEMTCMNWYNKCYKFLKSSEGLNGFPKRPFSVEEEFLVRKCITLFNDLIIRITVRSEMSKCLKINDNTAVNIDELSKQLDEKVELFQTFITNLQSLLGLEVKPELLRTFHINSDINVKELYEQLLKHEYLNAPEVKYPKIYSKWKSDDDSKTNEHIDDDEIVISIANQNNIDFKDLKNFLLKLKYTRKDGLDPFEDFGEKIIKNFKLPSREEFWDILMDKKILTDQVMYYIFDKKMLQEIDPSLYNILNAKYSNQKEMLKTEKKSEIFLASSKIYNQNLENIIIYKNSIIDTVIPKQRLEYLKNNGALVVNKRANFDKENYNKLKETKIFNNYDELSKKDLEKMLEFSSSSREDIIDKLTKSQNNKSAIFTKNGYDSYSLNFKMFFEFCANSGVEILENNKIYFGEILAQIRKKCAYRIALEKLVSQISNDSEENNNNIENEILISLNLSPHQNLLNDLISNRIVILASVNVKKVDKIHELSTDSLFQSAYNAVAEKVKFDDFDNNATLMFLNKCKEEIRIDLVEIKNRLNDFVPLVLNKNFSEMEVKFSLVPISEKLNDFNNKRNIEELAKSKAMDHLITVVQKFYTLNYWIKFVSVIAIGTVSILIGAYIKAKFGAIPFMSKLGDAFISEGINDLIFAVQTLSTGHFTWKDYGIYKAQSVTSTVISTLVVPFGIKFLGDKTGVNIFIKLGNYLTKVENVNKVGLIFKNQITKNIVENFATAVITESIDFILKNTLPDKLSFIISSEFNTNFKKHFISKLIDNNINLYGEEVLERIIIEMFEETENLRSNITGFVAPVFIKLASFIKIKNNIAAILTSFIAGITVQTLSITISHFTILDEVYNKTEDKLKKIKIPQHLSKTVSNDVKENLKNRIADALKEKLLQIFRNYFISVLLTSFIVSIGKIAVTFAKKTDLYQNFKANRILKNLITHKNNIDNLDVTTEKERIDRETLKLQDKLKDNLQRIIELTNKTETFSKIYNNFGILLSDKVSLTAALIVLNEHYGIDQIVVTKNNKTYEISQKTDPEIILNNKSNPNSKIEMKINNDNLTINSDQLGNDINQAFQNTNFNADDFRKNVSEACNNSSVRKLIQNNAQSKKSQYYSNKNDISSTEYNKAVAKYQATYNQGAIPNSQSGQSQSVASNQSSGASGSSQTSGSNNQSGQWQSVASTQSSGASGTSQTSGSNSQSSQSQSVASNQSSGASGSSQTSGSNSQSSQSQSVASNQSSGASGSSQTSGSNNQSGQSQSIASNQSSGASGTSQTSGSNSQSSQSQSVASNQSSGASGSSQTSGSNNQSGQSQGVASTQSTNATNTSQVTRSSSLANPSQGITFTQLRGISPSTAGMNRSKIIAQRNSISF